MCDLILSFVILKVSYTLKPYHIHLFSNISVYMYIMLRKMYFIIHDFQYLW